MEGQHGPAGYQFCETPSTCDDVYVRVTSAGLLYLHKQQRTDFQQGYFADFPTRTVELSAADADTPLKVYREVLVGPPTPVTGCEDYGENNPDAYACLFLREVIPEGVGGGSNEATLRASLPGLVQPAANYSLVFAEEFDGTPPAANAAGCRDGLSTLDNDVWNYKDACHSDFVDSLGEPCGNVVDGHLVIADTGTCRGGFGTDTGGKLHVKYGYVELKFTINMDMWGAYSNYNIILFARDMKLRYLLDRYGVEMNDWEDFLTNLDTELDLIEWDMGSRAFIGHQYADWHYKLANPNTPPTWSSKWYSFCGRGQWWSIINNPNRPCQSYQTFTVTLGTEWTPRGYRTFITVDEFQDRIVVPKDKIDVNVKPVSGNRAGNQRTLRGSEKDAYFEYLDPNDTDTLLEQVAVSHVPLPVNVRHLGIYGPREAPLHQDPDEDRLHPRVAARGSLLHDGARLPVSSPSRPRSRAGGQPSSAPRPSGGLALMSRRRRVFGSAGMRACGVAGWGSGSSRLVVGRRPGLRGLVAAGAGVVSRLRAGRWLHRPGVSGEVLWPHLQPPELLERWGPQPNFNLHWFGVVTAAERSDDLEMSFAVEGQHDPFGLPVLRSQPLRRRERASHVGGPAVSAQATPTAARTDPVRVLRGLPYSDGGAVGHGRRHGVEGVQGGTGEAPDRGDGMRGLRRGQPRRLHMPVPTGGHSRRARRQQRGGPAGRPARPGAARRPRRGVRRHAACGQRRGMPRRVWNYLVQYHRGWPRYSNYSVGLFTREEKLRDRRDAVDTADALPRHRAGNLTGDAKDAYFEYLIATDGKLHAKYGCFEVKFSFNVGGWPRYSNYSVGLFTREEKLRYLLDRYGVETQDYEDYLTNLDIEIELFEYNTIRHSDVVQKFANPGFRIVDSDIAPTWGSKWVYYCRKNDVSLIDNPNRPCKNRDTFTVTRGLEWTPPWLPNLHQGRRHPR